MVVLKPALNSFGRWDADDHVRRVEQLIARMKENGQLRFRVALGNFFTGPGSIARSYRTARTTMMVGKQRMPESRSYFYQDLMLPVLLDSLRGGWQAMSWPSAGAFEGHGQQRAAAADAAGVVSP